MPVYKSSKPTKDGRIYYFKISYVDNNGNQKQYASKLFKTKNEAIKEESKYRIHIGSAASDSFTFGEIASEIIEEQKRVQKDIYSLENKASHVLKHLENIKIEKLTASQYKQFYNYVMESEWTNKYKNQVLAFAKRCVKFSEKRYGITNRVPFSFDNAKESRLQITREYKVYTKEQFKQLISTVDDLKWKTFFSTLYYMGLRQGEANALQWKDIDFKKEILSISKTVDTKSKGGYKLGSTKTETSYRDLPIPSSVLSLLNDLKTFWKEYKHFNDEWFVFGGYRPIPNSTLQTAKTTYMKKANLPEIRLHDFRHSFASLCINELNLPITSISKYLGHKNAQITYSTYSHWYSSKLEDVAEKIDKFVGNL